MKKIFLTGASGKLGTILYPILNKKYKIFAISNKKKLPHTTKLNLANNLFLSKNLDKFSPDIIIHLASLTNVDFCEKNPEISYKTNVIAVSNLVNWCLKSKKKIKFIYISTDQIYNRKINKENDILNPLNFYSFSKLSAENLVLKLANSTVIRTNFFGHFPSQKDSLINWFLNELKKGKKVNLVTDINFNPLYVETLCFLIEKIVSRKNIKGIYNLGSKDRITKGGLLKNLAKKLNKNLNLFNFVKSNKINFFAKRPNNMVMSVNKIEKTLKIKMPTIDSELNLLKNELINNHAI